jgi:uncharacterized protein (UPF0335 family)
MTAPDELKQLIEQLVYLDHEHETDIAEHMTGLILDIKSAGLSKDEATELLNDVVPLMKLNSVLQNDEQLRMVEALIQHLPGLLFA